MKHQTALPIILPVPFLVAATFLLAFALAANANAQSSLQNEIRSFKLSGSSVQLEDRVFQRDRVTMKLNGTLYFAEPVNGRVTGAVFIGNGSFSAETAPIEYERAYVNRLIKADNIESSFTNAVFRFSDDTFEVLGSGSTSGSTPSLAAELAAEIDAKMLRQTGANLASRIAASIANSEPDGVFFGHFLGGKFGDFSYLFDPQTRIPAANFGLNGGEKGVIFNYLRAIGDSEVLTAFYSLADYQRGEVEYSDMADVIDALHHDIEVDLREPKKKLAIRMSLELQPLAKNVRAIPFLIGESLGEYGDARLKKQMRIRSAKLGGADVEFVQEDWEGGFTVFLSEPLALGKRVVLEITAEGDFLRQPDGLADFSYPRSNTAWYPRHGYLDRSTYSLTYLHPKKLKIGSVGRRVAESPWPEDKDLSVTTYSMPRQIALATFAIGPYQRHAETVTFDGTDRRIPLEYNSVSGAVLAIKEDFILAEISNSVRYFDKLFGAYPYETYSASFHPYGFGQGFPSMLMIPPTDRAGKYTYAFIAHETAHQWWGNIVAWRSYRDQWLSEGFAEYSGVLYTSLRENPKAARNLIEEMRDSLRRPPLTTTGIGKGKLNEVGPIILGHRLNSSKTFGGYQTLIYNKGGLVLRMLHFLFTDPSSGDGEPFFNMMRAFVEKHRDGTASTDDFRKVANEHFAKTPIARKYNISNLDWFFKQWVYETHLPKFRLEHTVEPQPDGSVMLTGHVLAENAPDDFFMPLPLAIGFGGNQAANGTVAAYGPKNAFRIKLPRKPQKVELDPNNWVLSESTSTK
ncbi:MAG: hypothetical protein IPM21_12875 [Acidobacteria bacterium]|nr:hypothetical protein [Acidobacteriota bacterium]